MMCLCVRILMLVYEWNEDNPSICSGNESAGGVVNI